jgi:hypothetical protein
MSFHGFKKAKREEVEPAKSSDFSVDDVEKQLIGE